MLPSCIDGSVHVADLSRAQLLRLWRKAEESIDLPFGEELHRLKGQVGDPTDIFFGIQADLRGHQLQLVRGGLEADTLAQVGDAPHTLPHEQLETADVQAGQQCGRLAGVSRGDELRPE